MTVPVTAHRSVDVPDLHSVGHTLTQGYGSETFQRRDQINTHIINTIMALLSPSEDPHWDTNEALMRPEFWYVSNLVFSAAFGFSAVGEQTKRGEAKRGRGRKRQRGQQNTRLNEERERGCERRRQQVYRRNLRI